MSRSKSRRSAPAALTYANLRLHAARNSCGQTPDDSEESCNSTTTAYSAVFATDDNNNNNDSSKNNGNFDLSDSGSSSIRNRLKRKCSINVSYTDDDTLYPVEEAKKYKKRGRPRKKAAAAADLPTPVVRYNDNLQQVDQTSIAFRKNLSVVELESYIKSRWGGLLNFDDKKNKKKRKRKTTTTTTTTKKRKKSNKAAVELPVAVVEYNEALRDRGPELPKPIIDYNNNLGKAVVDESSNVSSTTACAASEPLDHRPDFVARLSELRSILPALAAHLQSYEMLDAAGDYVDCLIVLFHYLDKREARISSSMMTMVEEMRRQETVAAFDEKVRRGYEVYLTMMGQ